MDLYSLVWVLEVFFLDKKGEMGIGTLIIFIAMILVAAIAAAVLIQTATSLQNKALLTGERSKSQVSTSLKAILVYAEDGSNDNDVDSFFMKMNLASGSDSIRLSDMLVEIDLSNMTADMIYNDTRNCSDVPSSSDGFAVDYLINSSNNADGYLQRGDVIMLCFKTPRNVTEDEAVDISIVPKIGNPMLLSLVAPDIIMSQRVQIYP
jgi:archaeal flagellin FlaB